jgi:predicted transcriptional regulator
MKPIAKTGRLVMSSIRTVPDHMERLSRIAASKGSASATIIRMLIAEYLRREEAKLAAPTK